MEVFADPDVSKLKFDRELAEYRKLEVEYQKKGWWMLGAKFPEVTVAFVSPKLKPPAVIFAVILNFENYDLWPPSVRIVDPFTRAPYTLRQLPSRFLRQNIIQSQPGIPPQFLRQELMVAHDPEEIPFLCLPGVREYHEHPAHTGDSWLLHRGTGEGKLFFLLDQIFKYGVEPIESFAMGMTVSVTGFNINNVPS